MRDLPPAVRMLGHPAVASTLTGALVLGFLGLAQAGPGGIMVALILLIPAAWVARAAEAVHRQRQWLQAWDNMLPTPPPRLVPYKAIAGVALLVGLLLWQGAGL